MLGKNRVQVQGGSCAIDDPIHKKHDRVVNRRKNLHSSLRKHLLRRSHKPISLSRNQRPRNTDSRDAILITGMAKSNRNDTGNAGVRHRMARLLQQIQAAVSMILQMLSEFLCAPVIFHTSSTESRMGHECPSTRMLMMGREAVNCQCLGRPKCSITSGTHMMQRSNRARHRRQITMQLRQPSPPARHLSLDLSM